MSAALEGIVEGLDETTYHAHESLSSTGAKLLLPEYKGSPKKFQYTRTHRRESRTFDFGHAAHAKILGVGNGTIVYPDEHLTPSGNVSTKKETVAWEQEQRAHGLVPVSPAEMGRVNAMAEAVLKHESAGPLLEVAEHREVSVFANVDGVPSRCRFDALSGQTRRGVIALDLKTAEDATKAGFERTVAKYGYDVQEGHYEDVYEASEGEPVNEFYFIACEKTAPFEVGVFRLPELWVQIGKQKAAEARRIYRECVETGVWPGYDSTIQFLDPPTWLVFDHETRYETEGINI